MSKQIGIWILMIMLASCKSQQMDLKSEPSKLNFGTQFKGKVTRLDSIANYYLIFVENEDSYFKIVSKKVDGKSNGVKIQLDSIYGFKINQITDRKGAYESNESGMPTPINYLDIAACRDFEGTEICTESSFELAKATNVVGLYIAENKNTP